MSVTVAGARRNCSGMRIDKHMDTLGNLPNGAGRHDARDAQLASNDRRVRGRAAELCDDRGIHRGVKPCGISRREIISQ